MNFCEGESADSLYDEFCRLHRRKFELLEEEDPDFLKATWFFPLYNSFDLFLRKFPTHQSRVELIEQLRANAIEYARSYEQAEFVIEQVFGET